MKTANYMISWLKLTEKWIFNRSNWPVFQAVCDVSAFKTRLKRSMHIYGGFYFVMTMYLSRKCIYELMYTKKQSLWLDEYAKLQYVHLFYFINIFIIFLS